MVTGSVVTVCRSTSSRMRTPKLRCAVICGVGGQRQSRSVAWASSMGGHWPYGHDYTSRSKTFAVACPRVQSSAPSTHYCGHPLPWMSRATSQCPPDRVVVGDEVGAGAALTSFVCLCAGPAARCDNLAVLFAMLHSECCVCSSFRPLATLFWVR